MPIVATICTRLLVRSRPFVQQYQNGGQRGLAVKLPSGNQKVGGSNPAAVMQVENENWTLGRPPAQKVPQ